MLRELFTHKLRKLQDEVLRTGSEVEQNLLTAVDVFIKRDNRKAAQLIKADEWVNQMRIDVGMQCLQLIATQQPAAQDMRLLAATIEIMGELERIHDYVKGIGKISLKIGDDPIPAELTQYLRIMVQGTCTMLHQALEAFSKCNAHLARLIPPHDNAVDQFYYQSYEAIINYVVRHPEEMEKSNWVEWASHNIERAADRVINICEWVVYMDEGVFKELD